MASAALHQTFTEILLYLAKEMPAAAGVPEPFGMPYTPEEIRNFSNISKDMIDKNIPSIVGATTRGEKIDSAEHRELVRNGRYWALHVLEPAYAWALSAAYVALTVSFKVMPFSSLLAAAGSLMPGAPQALAQLALGADILLYIFMPFISALILRIFQHRTFFARTGKRTLVIGDITYVHQLLEAYVSKLFSMSYGIASIDVHGANPQDHMLHRFGHRVTRGTLMLMGRPHGLLSEFEMTAKQAKGVQNMSTGAEVIAIGHTPSNNPNASDRSVTLYSPDEFKDSLNAPFYESRFASFERLIASYVLFHAMAQRVSRQYPIRYDISRTQSGTRIATTAAPVSGSAVSTLIQAGVKPGQAPKKVLDKPQALPFRIKNTAVAVPSAALPDDAGRKIPVKPVPPAAEASEKQHKPPAAGNSGFSVPSIDDMDMEGGSAPQRSELRIASPELLEALESKQKMADDIRLAQEINFTR